MLITDTIRKLGNNVFWKSLSKVFQKEKPWLPFLWIFAVVLLLISIYGWIVYNNTGNKFDWLGIHTESVGMLLDVIFLGVVWSIFEYRRSKKNEIKRYLEEINDFRSWKSEEATFRIVGNIRRLSNLGYTDIDLTYCFLKKADLWNLKTSGEATGAQFIKANMAGSDLRNINLSYADFEKAHLYDSKLNGSDIAFTNFKGTNLTKVDFRGCVNIEKAFFHGALFIWEAMFDDDVNVDRLKLQKQKESILGRGEPFFKKIEFVERNFHCSILEFRISEFNDNMIVLRFTKEGYVNFNNLMSIAGEHKHYYSGHLKLDELMHAMSDVKILGEKLKGV